MQERLEILEGRQQSEEAYLASLQELQEAVLSQSVTLQDDIKDRVAQLRQVMRPFRSPCSARPAQGVLGVLLSGRRHGLGHAFAAGDSCLGAREIIMTAVQGLSSRQEGPSVIERQRE